MKILGIDPGSRYTGWGVIQVTGHKMQCIAAGRLVLGDRPHAERLVLIYEGVSDIVSTYQPEVVGVESVFVSKNVQSALKLGQARGAALVAVAKANLEIFEISPRLVKKSVTGYGATAKVGVGDMVQRLLGCQMVLSEDAADALAIAISASSMKRSQV
ncbi:crossover junction endodeoxyribonuclease RuvC [Candidatus Synchoanobacter obligatus]|uniref:Crossover junction endodeoxyribonuclease RuvC n=1 Tax=Candidatus Synchoanobacter obligatus TaxID=2919597 RepID=A0ABT1L620_9GAMM|nr:crossover junction endodeoxyribonuclease RuvC [Candidatus Synchoanobacter obligatus]